MHHSSLGHNIAAIDMHIIPGTTLEYHTKRTHQKRANIENINKYQHKPIGSRIPKLTHIKTFNS